VRIREVFFLRISVADPHRVSTPAYFRKRGMTQVNQSWKGEN